MVARFGVSTILTGIYGEQKGNSKSVVCKGNFVLKKINFMIQQGISVAQKRIFHTRWKFYFRKKNSGTERCGGRRVKKALY
jgi:hypothetical protein